MVFIYMGNNQLLGGSNKTEWDWGIPVTNASVEIDGTTVVKDGGWFSDSIQTLLKAGSPSLKFAHRGEL